ncbi:adenylyltransferase/cytidyltransferase family protein [Candidatus Woesearchaeota archaeon]|nr:adenylyltransferase/cytidyltransferase family protein [Candidatus Woesearchaeota archaeon]
MEKSLLIVGRFQPFHLGHLHIIRKYHEQGFFVKIVVGSIKQSRRMRDPFSMEERDDMIRLALDEAEVEEYALYYLPDEADDQRWLRKLLRMVGSIDVVFSGNPWVTNLFRGTAVELHTYDEHKDRFGDISATAIRDEWLEKESSKGLPKAVFDYLRVIQTQERLKELKEKEGGSLTGDRAGS